MRFYRIHACRLRSKQRRTACLEQCCRSVGRLAEAQTALEKGLALGRSKGFAVMEEWFYADDLGDVYDQAVTRRSLLKVNSTRPRRYSRRLRASYLTTSLLRNSSGCDTKASLYSLGQ